jgi:hypothetical protein
MATEHPSWDYTRIRGVLANLGHEVAGNTLKRILQNHGIAPAPERSQRTPWKTFWLAQWAGLAAADFFPSSADTGRSEAVTPLLRDRTAPRLVHSHPSHVSARAGDPSINAD